MSKSKSQKRDRLGYLGDQEAKRLVKAFYQDTRLRNRAALASGVVLGMLLVWSELVLFYAMSH